jgi:hypothetical protein
MRQLRARAMQRRVRRMGDACAIHGQGMGDA